MSVRSRDWDGGAGREPVRPRGANCGRQTLILVTNHSSAGYEHRLGLGLEGIGL